MAAKDLSATDRFEIMELTARYAYYVDTFQCEPLVDLFTQDAVMDESRAGMGLHSGRNAIRTYFADGLFPRLTGIIHMTGNHIIDDVTEDGVRGKCSAIMEGDIRGGGHIHGTCLYDDTYVRTEEGWKFASRIVSLLTQLEAAALSESA
jgi:hypothetical protein